MGAGGTSDRHHPPSDVAPAPYRRVQERAFSAPDGTMAIVGPVKVKLGGTASAPSSQ